MKYRFFALLEILTVGFPFCAFKILMGNLLRNVSGSLAIGWLLMLLGVADVLFNTGNAFSLLLAKKRSLSTCALDFVFKKITPRAVELGTALDVMLSFTLVAAMVGFDLFHLLPHAALSVWTSCVVLNVLGAGVARLGQAIDAIPSGSSSP